MIEDVRPLLILFGFWFIILSVFADKANDQLPMFKCQTSGPIGNITTSNGAPVYANQIEPVNENLLFNTHFMDAFFRFDRERIPERVVHAKGAGAYGYFEVTKDISDICKAKLFCGVGKKTPVFVRFSSDVTERGGSDTNRELRGLACKFYTEDGIFDLLTLSTEMFTLKNPLKFIDITHATKKNPQTNLYDYNSQWDYITLNPEALYFVLRIYADRGIPDGYRHVLGYALHPFQVFNKDGKISFVKFLFIPDAGEKYLTSDKAAEINKFDLDYGTRDLYNAIAKKKYPSWTLLLTVMSLDEVKKAKFDVFDITRIWPQNITSYTIGKLVLNKNPSNYHAEVEQVAMNPGNLVPGILGGVDAVFQARRFSYKDAITARLGILANQVPVNRPTCPMFNYYRDSALVLENGENAPNYYPNSFNGPVVGCKRNPPLWKPCVNPEPNNYDQATELYEQKLNASERVRMICNLYDSLKYVEDDIQNRALELFDRVSSDLSDRIERLLCGNSTECSKNKKRGSNC